MGIKKVHWKNDFKLVTGQIKREYQTKESDQMAKGLIKYFEDFVIIHVPREQNDKAMFFQN